MLPARIVVERGEEAVAIRGSELGEGDALAAQLMRRGPLRVRPHDLVRTGVSREVHGISLPHESITTMAA